MPRPRAPTRELFEFTNKRRTGGKCDLYRCKRCGREMLENTHRFAIHISICKAATDQDREIAMGQLRKTKKYNMKQATEPVPVNSDNRLQKARNERSNRLYSVREAADDSMLPPSAAVRHYHQRHHQFRDDISDNQLDSATAAFDTLARAPGPVFDNHYRATVMSDELRGYANAATRSAHQQLMTAGGGAGSGLFDNYHRHSFSRAASPAVLFDHRHRTSWPRQRFQMPPSSHYPWGSIFPPSAEPMQQPYMF